MRRGGSTLALVLGALALALAGPAAAGAHKGHTPCGKTKTKHAHKNCGKHKGQLKHDAVRDEHSGSSSTSTTGADAPRPNGTQTKAGAGTGATDPDDRGKSTTSGDRDDHADEPGKAIGEDKHHPDHH
jgi:hypothetical protein